MTTPTTVIFHSADYDGLFSREVAKRFLGTDNVTYIGWDYGDPLIPTPADGTIYIIDLNPDCLERMPGIDEAKARIIWIDHHASAIQKGGTYLPGYRIDGVAACRLAWQWFSIYQYPKDAAEVLARQGPLMALPEKQDFIDRKVQEPFALTLAGEYDIWDHRGDGDLELQFGLRTEETTPWHLLLSMENSHLATDQLISAGKIAMAYSKHVDASTCRRAFQLTFQGLKFIALNTARFNSQTFESVDNPEYGHEALMGFNWNGKKWTFSLYHAAHRKDIDLSQIAKAYGGGGHRGACGFQTDQIPFPLFPSSIALGSSAKEI